PFGPGGALSRARYRMRHRKPWRRDHPAKAVCRRDFSYGSCDSTQGVERVSERGERGLDVFRCMCGSGDRVQSGRGTGVDTEFEELVRQALIGGTIDAGAELAAVANPRLLREQNLEHRPNALHDCIHATSLKYLAHAGTELPGDRPHV